MAIFSDLDAEEKREYVEQGIAHFKALKNSIVTSPLVKAEALADGDDAATAQAIADRREARLVSEVKPIPTPDSVIADIAENLANLPVAEPPIEPGR